MRGIIKQLASFGIILFLFLVSNGAQNKKNTETLEATVVAYDAIKGTTPCYRDCEGSLIVRIESPGNQIGHYARIDFRFRNSSRFPRQLIKEKRLWRFSVIRTTTLDEPIYEYIVQQPTSRSEEKRFPIWVIVPGAQDDELPFGKTLPSYTLVGDEFKQIK